MLTRDMNKLIAINDMVFNHKDHGVYCVSDMNNNILTLRDKEQQTHNVDINEVMLTKIMKGIWTNQ